MKNALHVLILLIGYVCFAQVGVNTNTPAPDAALDVDGNDKGILIPRVDLADLSTIDPIAPVTGGNTESLLVFNTNVTTGKGFYYWSGARWIPVGDGLFWNKNGNAGSTPGTATGENFLGTKDATDLVIATNSSESLRITSTGQVLANELGSNTAPTYSFNNDTDTGIYADGADHLNIAAGGVNMLELDGTSNGSIIINKDSEDLDTRIASQGESHMLYVDAGNNRVGVAQDTPLATLHVGGASSTVQIDAFDSSNVNNDGVVSTPVFVDGSGKLSLEGSNVITRLVVDDTSFLNTAEVVDYTTGNRTVQLLDTRTINLTQDALIEVVYQVAVDITDTNDDPIDDGRPRVYRVFAEITPANSGVVRRIGYKGDSYTSENSTGVPVTGPFYLNGNGYVQLDGDPNGGAGYTHTIKLYAEVFGKEASTRCTYGGPMLENLLQILVRY